MGFGSLAGVDLARPVIGTLTAFTYDVDNNDYDDNRDVLSDMIESLDIR